MIPPPTRLRAGSWREGVCRIHGFSGIIVSRLIPVARERVIGSIPVAILYWFGWERLEKGNSL